MTRLKRIAAVAMVLAIGSGHPCALMAQPVEKALTFDVASVKPARVPDGVTVLPDGRVTVPRGSGIEIPRRSGGPGTQDPGRIHYPLIALKELLKLGWDSYYAIESPGWLDTEIVAVDATMPPQTTKAQFQEMLRNLVTERFGLKYHIEAKEVTGYDLVVAKGGPKMKASPPLPAPPKQDGPIGRPRPQSTMGPDGFLIPPPPPEFASRRGPCGSMMTMRGNRSRIFCQWRTMQDLALQLGELLNATVSDATGLAGTYDFTITFAGVTERGGALASLPDAGAPDGAEPLPNIFNAVQSQLGLRLEAKKVSVSVMVVDHMEKTPAGN